MTSHSYRDLTSMHRGVHDVSDSTDPRQRAASTEPVSHFSPGHYHSTHSHATDHFRLVQMTQQAAAFGFSMSREARNGSGAAVVDDHAGQESQNAAGGSGAVQRKKSSSTSVNVPVGDLQDAGCPHSLLRSLSIHGQYVESTEQHQAKFHLNYPQQQVLQQEYHHSIPRPHGFSVFTLPRDNILSQSDCQVYNIPQSDLHLFGNRFHSNAPHGIDAVFLNGTSMEQHGTSALSFFPQFAPISTESNMPRTIADMAHQTQLHAEAVGGEGITRPSSATFAPSRARGYRPSPTSMMTSQHLQDVAPHTPTSHLPTNPQPSHAPPSSFTHHPLVHPSPHHHEPAPLRPTQREQRTMCTAEDVAQRYDISRELGTGNFADVFEAFDRVSGTPVAIKVLKQQHSNDVSHEGDITAVLCNHVNIIEFLREFWVGDVAHFVFEYADGGDLFNFVADSENLDSEADCKAYLLQACAGLAHVHEQGFVHMDVKMENMLLVNNTVKLCDFGLAGPHGQVRRGVADGTTAYMAPELVTAVMPSDVYTIRCPMDCWSFAIVIYNVLFGQQPWGRAAYDDVDFITFVTDANPHANTVLHIVAPQLRQTMLAMLSTDPARRPPMRDVAPALAGAWLSDFEDHEDHLPMFVETDD